MNRLLGLCVLAGLLAASAGVSAETFTVSQKNRQFTPNTLKLKVGDSIKFAADDEDFVHHVYSKNEIFDFDTGEQAPLNAIEVKFPKKGMFEVRCAIHPKMKLLVTVE